MDNKYHRGDSCPKDYKKLQFEISKNYNLVLDNHGIRWILKYNEHDKLKFSEVDYYKLNVPHKILFLEKFMDNLDSWIIDIEIKKSNEFQDKVLLKNTFIEKKKIFYDYLQSLRVDIETVFDSYEHKLYLQNYDRIKTEFEIQESLLFKSVNISLWSEFKKFINEIINIFNEPPLYKNGANGVLIKNQESVITDYKKRVHFEI